MRGSGRSNIPLAHALNADTTARLRFEATREGVLSWNTLASRGAIWFRLLRAGQPSGDWLLHMQWEADGRQSHSPEHDDVRVDTDVIRSTHPFDGIDIRAEGVFFTALAFATPGHRSPSLPYAGRARILDVEPRSQYVDDARGWCSPTSLSMLNAFFGLSYDVPATARAVFDRAYNGTGNWSFNVAFSGSLGLRAAVAYLQNLDHAQRFIDAGIPLALSYSWSGDELPGAPLDHSDGHLAVLCGFAENGDCIVNDPAHHKLHVAYPRSALESVWQRNNGVAYVVAPAGLDVFSIAET